MDLATTDNAQRWLDAQHSVLGAILLDGNLMRTAAMELTEAHFTGTCRTIYKAMRKLFLDGTEVDPVAVVNQIGNEYTGFVQGLMQIVPTTANFSLYVEIAKEQAAISAMRDLGQQLSTCNSLDDARGLMAQLQQAAAGRQTRKAISMADGFRAFLQRQKEQPNYLQFPMVALNNHLFVEAGDYIVVGGEPSTGKTALTLQMAAHFAETRKVGYFSLETSDKRCMIAAWQWSTA